MHCSLKSLLSGIPWWLSGKEFTCQWRRCRVNPRCRKIPHTAEQLRWCIMTIEPCSIAWELQHWATCPATAEVTAMRTRTHLQTRPPPGTSSPTPTPSSPQLKKSPHKTAKEQHSRQRGGEAYSLPSGSECHSFPDSLVWRRVMGHFWPMRSGPLLLGCSIQGQMQDSPSARASSSP